MTADDSVAKCFNIELSFGSSGLSDVYSAWSNVFDYFGRSEIVESPDSSGIRHKLQSSLLSEVFGCLEPLKLSVPPKQHCILADVNPATSTKELDTCQPSCQSICRTCHRKEPLSGSGQTDSDGENCRRIFRFKQVADLADAIHLAQEASPQPGEE